MNVKTFVSHPGPKPRECGCKGIRSCRLCEATHSTDTRMPKTSYSYCLHCGIPWQDTCTLKQSNDSIHIHSKPEEKEENLIEDNQVIPTDHHGKVRCVKPQYDVSGKSETNQCQSTDFHIEKSAALCNHEHSKCLDIFKGVLILEDFVTEEEEMTLSKAISETQFVNSQSGRKKQDYGPKVNFKKQKLNISSFRGLPFYSRFLYDYMKAHPSLQDFEPVELCNLEYCETRGAHIDPHHDDAWLWGNRLVTLNLLSDSTLTFTLDSDPDLEVRVPLLRRSLIIVFSDARYKWKHSINSSDIKERRIAMTFRELSQKFCLGGTNEHEGSELLKLALTFQGCAVNSIKKCLA